MQRRSNFLPAPAGIHTGEHCPHTGWWDPASEEATKASAAAPAAPQFIGEGNLMPAINGIPGIWLPCPPSGRKPRRTRASFNNAVYAEPERR